MHKRFYLALNQLDTLLREQPNGLRYPRVGGARERHFAGANLKPCNLPENAARTHHPLHAVLGGVS